jgi:glycosyltransferase involved in cell wall biosynthesis
MTLENRTVSVVIPVRNEAKNIRKCIEGLQSQSVSPHEIIVVDSGSTDATLEILAEYESVRVVSIAPGEFNHGDTRNLGIQQTTGEFILMTVGDAWSADKRVIERLIERFDSDDIAGVSGCQVVPHDHDKNPMEWFRPQSEPTLARFAYASAAVLDALPPDELREACSFDNVIAMYRGSVLRHEIPFQRTTYFEDGIWAKDALRAGHTLISCPAARVYHYHMETTETTFKKSLTVLYYRHKLFKQLPSPPRFLRPTLSLVKLLLQDGSLGLAERARWFSYNLNNRRAMLRAHSLFCQAVCKSDAAVEKLYADYLGSPPIPVKSTPIPDIRAA